jgi:hypothetical protein
MPILYPRIRIRISSQKISGSGTGQKMQIRNTAINKMTDFYLLGIQYCKRNLVWLGPRRVRVGDQFWQLSHSFLDFSIEMLLVLTGCCAVRWGGGGGVTKGKGKCKKNQTQKCK